MARKNYRERLVRHVQELEQLEEVKREASAALVEGYKAAKADGYDTTTLKVVLKLRRMTPSQRQERRALEAIYMAALGMLDGDPLPDEARRRLDPEPPDQASQPPQDASTPRSKTPQEEQPPLIQQDPAEARKEGAAAAAAGQRIYDNPYRAGDPCRAAWDEGWCGQRRPYPSLWKPSRICAGADGRRRTRGEGGSLTAPNRSTNAHGTAPSVAPADC